MLFYSCIVLSANITVSVGIPSQFSCEVLCEQSLLVTWLINGKFLSQLGSIFSTQTSSDYSLQCTGSNTYTTTLQVLTHTHTPYTVQCAAVATCNQGDETTPCTSEVCYSHPIQVEGIVSSMIRYLRI